MTAPHQKVADQPRIHLGGIDIADPAAGLHGHIVVRHFLCKNMHLRHQEAIGKQMIGRSITPGQHTQPLHRLPGRRIPVKRAFHSAADALYAAQAPVCQFLHLLRISLDQHPIGVDVPAKDNMLRIAHEIPQQLVPFSRESLRLEAAVYPLLLFQQGKHHQIVP